MNPRAARASSLSPTPITVGEWRDKFARFFKISALSKVAGDSNAMRQLADRGTLQGGHIRGLVEHLLDLVEIRRHYFRVCGIDP